MLNKQNLFLITCIILISFISAQNQNDRGMYFPKKQYSGEELPDFKDSRTELPQPVLGDNPEWVDMYWSAWEYAFDHFKKPPEDSPFVSNILDEAFNSNIFQWDMIFMMMFARYGNHVFPAVNSLDNFYCNQHKSGYICREISEKDGSDFVYRGRKNTINPPLFGWAELESFEITGDTSRLKIVVPVLEKYSDWLNRKGTVEQSNGDNWIKYGRKSTSEHGLFWNTKLGSGMDNIPLKGNGWVDMSSQMVILYKNIARMHKILDNSQKSKHYQDKAKNLGNRINQYCWNEKDGIYYNVDSTGQQLKSKSIASFWPLLAGIVSEKQSESLVNHLTDSAEFWRKVPFPTLPADHPEYHPRGGYWRGGVWAPKNYMAIKGLERNGYKELAQKASEKYIEAIYQVYRCTDTFWENYMPDYYAPGQPSRPDFVGWTGIGPISLLIENILGFQVNASKNQLIWRINRTDRHGIKNLKVGDIGVDAICKSRKNKKGSLNIEISNSKKLNLVIIHKSDRKTYTLEAGEHSLTIK